MTARKFQLAGRSRETRPDLAIAYGEAAQIIGQIIGEWFLDHVSLIAPEKGRLPTRAAVIAFGAWHPAGWDATDPTRIPDVQVPGAYPHATQTLRARYALTVTMNFRKNICELQLRAIACDRDVEETLIRAAWVRGHPGKAALLEVNQERFSGIAREGAVSILGPAIAARLKELGFQEIIPASGRTLASVLTPNNA